MQLVNPEEPGGISCHSLHPVEISCSIPRLWPRCLLEWTRADALRASTVGAKKIKVGQIGVGHSHAAGKIRVLRGSPDWEVVGVVENDPKLRHTASQSEEYQGLTWMTEEELLNTPNLKAVAVETLVDDSLDTAQRCIDAGMHIHLDKPPGSKLREVSKPP